MKLIKGNTNGILILKPDVHIDHRGYFIESYNKKKFNKLVGQEINFVQDNYSKSSRGTIRGLHFQNPPYTQSKLVKCVKGEIMDIVLDLRKDSKTYGVYETTILSDKNNLQIFIPKGFAHGFFTLSEDAIISYKVDNFYMPGYENGVLFDDETLKMNCNTEKKFFNISEKDRKLKTIGKINNPF